MQLGFLVRAGGLLCACLLAHSPPAWAIDIGERIEIHGELATSVHYRSPSFDFGRELQLSRWRTTLELDVLMRLRDSDGWRIELAALVRPSYDAVYDLYPERWGDRARGAASGTSNFANLQSAINGKTFPGHGATVLGEFTLLNQDGVELLTGQSQPGTAVNPTFVGAAGVAPWAAKGGRQPKVGGFATAQVFALAATGATGAPGAAELANSLALAGSSPFAPQGLATPLNAYAGALGDRGSLHQLPAELNASENKLALSCFENSHPQCWLQELFLDVERDNTFVRIGRQIISWGKTDSFQLQDVINPTDEGILNVFPSLEERRIPVWAVRLIQTIGTAGPFEDVSLELAWVVDEFRPRQIGQCGEPFAFTLSCQLRLNAAGHQGLNLGLAEVDERKWNLSNSEPGARLDFYLPEPGLSFSLSAFWGFQDVPVLAARNLYSTENPNAAALLLLQAQGAGPTIDSLANGAPVPGEDPSLRPWVNGFDPYARDANGLPVDTLAKANADLLTVWDGFIAPNLPGTGDPRAEWVALEDLLEGQFGLTQGALSLPWGGSEQIARYPRVLTLGASVDYDWALASTVVRAEMAYEVDRALINTSKASVEDGSDVFKLAVGLDRSLRIPFVSDPREAFVSAQIFWEHIVDYEDGSSRGDGMVLPENGLLSTFLMRNYWWKDALTLETLVVVDWSHRAYGVSPTLAWAMNDNVTLEIGAYVLSGRRRKHGFRDVCVGGSLDCLADPRTWQAGQWQTLNRGIPRGTEAPFWPESFADRVMDKRDGFFFGASYAF